MNIQSSGFNGDKAYYIYFKGNGTQTWSLENICMNLTSDSNQLKIDDSKAHVTYTKKVNVGERCPYGFHPATKTPEQRPTSPASMTHEWSP